MKFPLTAILCIACGNNDSEVVIDAAKSNGDGQVVVDSGPEQRIDAACILDVPSPLCTTELFDSNGDGCKNRCCESCPPDFVANNGYRIEDGQCMPNGCADAPCTPDMPCSKYGCGYRSGCNEPMGICAAFFCRGNGGDERCDNLDEQPGDPVCGCDGKTYSNECALQCVNGTLDHYGACI